ncbi:MAG: Hpt domain-containing protein [Bacteroidota bacterium]|nr:Hpt domain-containing protein [Bacteroidota bacterium]
MQEEKLYNLLNLTNMIGTEKESIQEFVKIFIKLANETLEDINSNFDKKNYVKVGELAHKLKASIDIIGISSLKNNIREIENNGKEETNIDKIPNLIEKLNDVINKTIVQLEKDIL